MVKLLVVLDLCTTAVVRTGMSCKSSIYGIKVTMLNGGGVVVCDVILGWGYELCDDM